MLNIALTSGAWISLLPTQHTRGTQVRAGSNVGVGSDHTLFAKVTGKVQFQKKGAEQRLYVSVLPEKA